MSQSNNTRSFIRGILLIIGIHIIVTIVGTAIFTIISMILPQLPSTLALFANNIITALLLAFFGIGITQLIYVVPAIVILQRRQRYEMMKGVITAAVITALLNGACYIYVMSLFQ